LERDFLLVAGTAVVSSLLTYLACTTSTQPDAHLPEVSATHGIASAPSIRAEDKTIHAEVGGNTPLAADALLQTSSQRNSAARRDSNAAKDPAVAIQGSQELGDRFSILLDNHGKPDSNRISAKIENRFYSEEWNQQWAGSKERSIRTLFDDNEDLSGMTPLQVTCRSKNCQVIFSASDQNQVRMVSEKFMRAATRGDVGMKNKLVSFFPDVSMGRLVFYLSEDGNRDLFE
jgi:hypothetical protein